MKAIYRTTYGSVETLELREIDKPVPKENQVLVKLRAVSVNPLDWHLMRGEPVLVRLMGYGIFKPKHPILGADMAGVVEAVGSNVKDFKAGDEVFGSGLGGFAEYACIRADLTAHKPANLTFEQAAAVPVAALTALQALRNSGKIEAGQNVLINGASGGVGSFAVQIAKHLGGQVTGVCSRNNVELVQSLGADRVLDYTKEDYWAGDEQYDLIIDTAAFLPIGKPLRVLKKSGRYVVVGGSSSTVGVLISFIVNPLVAMMKGKKVETLMANVSQSDLMYMKELLEAGKVVPVVDRQYPFEETAEAIKYVEQGHTRGKVVINI